MTEIVLIRHAETELNRAGVFRGRLDVPLNDRGRRQAGRLAEALAGSALDAVYTSPLVRATETARAVASGHGLEPVVDEALNNIDLGTWQGRKKTEVEREEPELWRLWTTDPDRLEIPGGETLAGVGERAFGRALELLREHDAGRIAVVSHRSVIKLLAARMLGIESGGFWRLYMDNAGYSVFAHRDGGFVLIKWNEACHLTERVVEDR